MSIEKRFFGKLDGKGDVDIYKINNEDEESFAASFEYNNAFYVIWGKMPFKEFEEMIKKIKV